MGYAYKIEKHNYIIDVHNRQSTLVIFYVLLAKLSLLLNSNVHHNEHKNTA